MSTPPLSTPPLSTPPLSTFNKEPSAEASTKANLKFDIAVVGSGLAGLLASTALSAQGFSVCLVERGPISSSPISSSPISSLNCHQSSDGRTLHLSAKSLDIINSITPPQTAKSQCQQPSKAHSAPHVEAAFPIIKKGQYAAIKHIYSFERDGRSVLEFNHQGTANASQGMGYVVSTATLRHELYKAANAIGVVMLPFTAVEGIQAEEGTPQGPIIHISPTPQATNQATNQAPNQAPNQSPNQATNQAPNQSPNQSPNQASSQAPNQAAVNARSANSISANLVLFCGGRGLINNVEGIKEVFRHQLISRSYQQSAIVFNIAHSNPHRGIAVESFHKNGVIASLPFFDCQHQLGQHASERNISAIIWSESSPTASYLMSLQEDAFLEVFRHAVSRFRHLGNIESLTSKRQAWPLSIHCSKKLFHNGVMLLGDALNSVHPVAGQAFNMTVQDVNALTSALVKARHLGIDIGSNAALNPLVTSIIKAHLPVNIATDLLLRVFASSAPFAKQLRSLGIATIERTPKLKSIMMHIAGGKTPG